MDGRVTSGRTAFVRELHLRDLVVDVASLAVERAKRGSQESGQSRKEE